MSKLAVLTAVATMTFAGVTASSASAFRHPTTGPRISLLFATPATFPADSPFFVAQGWSTDAGEPTSDVLDPGTRFELMVDGRDVPAAHELDYNPNAPFASEFDISNFRDGLPAGPHAIEGTITVNGVTVFHTTVVITFV